MEGDCSIRAYTQRPFPPGSHLACYEGRAGEASWVSRVGYCLGCPREGTDEAEVNLKLVVGQAGGQLDDDWENLIETARWYLIIDM